MEFKRYLCVSAHNDEMLLLTACALLLHFFDSFPYALTYKCVDMASDVFCLYVEKGRKDVNMMLMGKIYNNEKFFCEIFFVLFCFCFMLCMEKRKSKIIKRAEFIFWNKIMIKMFRFIGSFRKVLLKFV